MRGKKGHRSKHALVRSSDGAHCIVVPFATSKIAFSLRSGVLGLFWPLLHLSGLKGFEFHELREGTLFVFHGGTKYHKSD